MAHISILEISDSIQENQLKIINTRELYDKKYPELHFSAISYCWSEGLTNEIRAYLTNVKDEWSWLDYISNKGLGQKDLQYVISDMASIFTRAIYTIISPEEIEQVIRKIVTTHRIQVDDIIKVIDNGKWFSRAWTLQEALVANTLCVLVDGEKYDITIFVHICLYKQIVSYVDLSYLMKYISVAFMRKIAIRDGENICVAYHRYLKDIVDDTETPSMGKLQEIKKMAIEGRLSKLHAIQLVARREAGDLNKDYEPILYI